MIARTSSSSLALRPVTEADLPMLEEWFRDPVLSGELGGMLPLERFYRYVRSEPRYWEWIALDGDEPVGFCAVEIQDDGIGYTSHATRPDLRRRGYGTAILRTLIAAPEARSAASLVAGVAVDNVASRRCHEKAGFVCEGEDPDDEGFLRFVYRFDR